MRRPHPPSGGTGLPAWRSKPPARHPRGRRIVERRTGRLQFWFTAARRPRADLRRPGHGALLIVDNLAPARSPRAAPGRPRTRRAAALAAFAATAPARLRRRLVDLQVARRPRPRRAPRASRFLPRSSASASRRGHPEDQPPPLRTCLAKPPPTELLGWPRRRLRPSRHRARPGRRACPPIAYLLAEDNPTNRCCG